MKQFDVMELYRTCWIRKKHNQSSNLATFCSWFRPSLTILMQYSVI